MNIQLGLNIYHADIRNNWFEGGSIILASLFSISTVITGFGLYRHSIFNHGTTGKEPDRNTLNDPF